MGKSVLLKQGGAETKPKARAKGAREIMRSSYYLCLSLLVIGLFMGFWGALLEIPPLGFGIGLLCLVVLGVFFERWIEMTPEKERAEIESLRRKFRKCFGLSIDWRWFSKDTSDQSWKDKHSKQQLVIQKRIDEVVPQLGKDFLDACEAEKKLMKPYYEQSKEKTDPKKTLKELERIQRRISLTKDKLQNAINAAKSGGFKAEYKITKERKIEKEKQEEKVKS